MAQSKSPFGISAYLQNTMCYLASLSVFNEASKLIKTFLGIDMDSRQIQRVSESYGEKIEEQMAQYDPEVLPTLPSPKEEEPVIVSVDGSMIFTLVRKWMEIKLARIYYESQNIDIQEKRSEIQRSIYISHLGSCDEFFVKLERFLIPYKHKVFLGDGARWIWKWVEDNYPGSIQIVDIWHALEKLIHFASEKIKDEAKRKEWVETQKEKLLDNGVMDVVESVKQLKACNKETQKAKQTLINYYTENEDRMQYKTFKEKGLPIGSGNIEAAHRNIIQKRLKLSGQHWSIKGAQAISNLRNQEKSDNWGCIRYLIKTAA